MKHLYLCRHGESVLNVQRIYAGRIDTPLTDRGRNQARAAGERAFKLNLDLIVSSPLVRALETAQIIAHEIAYPLEKIITSDLLIEQSFGSLQGQSFDIPADFKKYPDMESAAALTNRAQAALEYLHGLDAKNILVVSHGSFANALRKIIEPDVYEELQNAHIVQLT